MSAQDQNTPHQKDARPTWARLRTKAAEGRSLQYSRADMLR